MYGINECDALSNPHVEQWPQLIKVMAEISINLPTGPTEKWSCYVTIGTNTPQIPPTFFDTMQTKFYAKKV